MATNPQHAHSGGDEGNEVPAASIQRSLNKSKSSVTNMMSDRMTVTGVSATGVVLIVFVPYAVFLLPPLMVMYFLWASRIQYRLPYRMPVEYNYFDYSLPKPGQQGIPSKFERGSGILLLGNEKTTGEMLFINRDDATRHMFCLGTTGSGKALSLDTLVLTEMGWKLNRDLVVGEKLFHPYFGNTKIESIHPQEEDQEAVRLWLADGRHAECSLDHLWSIVMVSRDAASQGAPSSEEKVMKAGDIGIFLGMYGDTVQAYIPLSRAYESVTPLPRSEDVVRMAQQGLGLVDEDFSVRGTESARRRFLAEFLSVRNQLHLIREHDKGLHIRCFDEPEAHKLRDIFWSLGGIAMITTKSDGTIWVMGNLPHLREIWPSAPDHLEDVLCYGNRIMEVETLGRSEPMQCIKVDRPDGLFMMENFIVTHNTELLLGIVSQSMMWSSGFIFIDGKGSADFYSRAWGLARRFGREDDLRLLNYTDSGSDPDAPAGNYTAQTNTMNPFAKGSPDQLINMIYSLMGNPSQGGDMWKGRAMALVSSAMRALCEMRDAGDILLDVQAIREFLPLGIGVRQEDGKGKRTANRIQSVDDVTEEQWEEIRKRGGLIELYLRALNNEFSSASLMALQAFFDTLPGFSLDKALNGAEQEGKASEQYSYLSMQLTQPLGQLADGFGNIFKTPLSEVDIFDVVFNRRILVVLLPALQKDKEELRNCGKLIIALLKMMMGSVLGPQIQGSTRELIDSSPTVSSSPLFAVLDEAGYYLVDGVDIILAQARSLAFSTVLAGQDMAAMQQVSKQIAQTASANARLLIVGATEDATETVDFVTRKIGSRKVAVSAGYQAQSGLLDTKYVDRMDVQFQDQDRVTKQQLQALGPGEFYYLFESVLVKANCFFTGSIRDEESCINRFLKIRGPNDRVPGLDQDRERAFLSAYQGIGIEIADAGKLAEKARSARGYSNGDFEDYVDDLVKAVRDADALLERISKVPDPKKVLDAHIATIIANQVEDDDEVSSDITADTPDDTQDDADQKNRLDMMDLPSKTRSKFASPQGKSVHKGLFGQDASERTAGLSRASREVSRGVMPGSGNATSDAPGGEREPLAQTMGEMENRASGSTTHAEQVMRGIGSPSNIPQPRAPKVPASYDVPGAKGQQKREKADG